MCFGSWLVFCLRLLMGRMYQLDLVTGSRLSCFMDWWSIQFTAIPLASPDFTWLAFLIFSTYVSKWCFSLHVSLSYENLIMMVSERQCFQSAGTCGSSSCKWTVSTFHTWGNWTSKLTSQVEFTCFKCCICLFCYAYNVHDCNLTGIKCFCLCSNSLVLCI